MSKQKKSSREGKKQPLMTAKEKRAAKRSKKRPSNDVTMP